MESAADFQRTSTPSHTAAGLNRHWDWIIVGSGFGGSVSALRLAEKGYSVLVLEKGRRFRSQDFARSNWNLRRWLWLPGLGCRGILNMSFFRHMTVLSGVGVGGGSLVYANTLPTPRDAFFSAPEWSHLASWKEELAPHYQTALRMLGAAEVPFSTPADDALAQVAQDLGRSEHHQPTRVGVWFGERGKTVPDPYFDGKGPPRTGCTRCGACMVGCRVGAKNTLDHNYLHLAEGLGVSVLADTEVTAVRQPDVDGLFSVEARQCLGYLRHRKLRLTASRVVLAGGVLGTVPLLLRMAEDSNGLPRLSPQVGCSVRTNCESLTGVQTLNGQANHSQGVAIGSILHLDDQTHLEPVRFPAGSGFFRLLMAPHASGDAIWHRLAKLALQLIRHPWAWFRVYFTGDWAKRSVILLYMRSHPDTLQLRLSGMGKLRSVVGEGPAPTGNMPEADHLGERMAQKLEGVTGALVTQTLLGTPTTAHILGGCAMGSRPEEGVINARHEVWGHAGLFVVDGSAVSANLGVNPALTITALAERAMSKVPNKSA